MSWKRNKFNAVKVECDGRRFDSMLERSVYGILKADPNVEILQCQVTVYLGPTRYCYRPDFKIHLIDKNVDAYVEAKGFSGGRWPQTKKQWKAFGPCDLFIYMGSHLKPKLTEIILPNKEICVTCGK